MKKRISVLTVLAGFVLMIVTFSACKKNLDNVTPTPVAGLMAFNLVPDSLQIGFAISGNNFTNVALNYTDYTGNYRGVYVGTRDVASYNFATGNPLVTTSQVFADSSYYSAFVIGTSGNYKNVIVRDNFDSLSSTSGNAYIRYINAVADSTLQPTVIIAANNTNIVDTTATFGSVSNFKAVTPGNISINVNAEASATASRTIAVEQGKIYTILLVGKPASTDSTRTVQIKYILNGQVTP